MKNIIIGLVLAFAVLFGGCASLAPQPVHGLKVDAAGKPVEKTPLELARNAVDEVYATVISLNGVIEDNARGGVWSYEQAKAYLAESKALRRRADNAKNLLDLGDLSTAQLEAEAINKLAAGLHKKIAESARTP
jgi:hypothetical protein